MTTPQTPAGWYPDPDGSGGHRYWDGQMWTEHRAPAPAPPAPPPPPPPPPPAAPETTAEPAVAPQRVGAHRAPEPEDEPSYEPQAEPEAAPDSSSAATAVIPTTPPPAFASDATAVIPTLPPPPGPPPADPQPYPQPVDGSRGVLVPYLAVCAALLAVLVGVVVYAFVNAGSGDVTITQADATTTPVTEPTEPTGTTEPTETTATESTEPTETTATEPPPPPPGGTTDGALAFSVLGIEIGSTVASTDAPIEKTAVGEFVVVHLTVTNVSDAPATFLGTFQKLKAAGAVFSIDDEATFYAGGGIAELNPGDQVDVGLAFDVPPGTVPEAIELHVDPMSPGIEVPLAQ